MIRKLAKMLSVLSLPLIGLLPATEAQAVVYSVNNVGSAGATLDLSPSKTYTHKLDFPGDGSSTAINGVQLSAVGTAGVDPLTGNAFTLSMANPSAFSSGSSAVLTDFIHNSGQPAGAVETLTLSGLTAGTNYDARLYYRNFGGRPNTVTLNTGSGVTVIGTVDQLPSPTNESYVTIKYKAESTSAVFTFAQQIATASWHQYAVTNEVVTGNLNGASSLIQGLFNTGVNNNGVSVTDNSIDSHWTLTGQGSASSVTGPNAIVATSAGGFPIGPWLADSTLSAWITPANDTNGPSFINGSATYLYTTQFSTGEVGNVSLTGQSASDNGIVGFTVDGIAGSFISSGFGTFANFSFDGLLGAGLHTLAFTVQNGVGSPNNNPGPTGLRVQFTSAIFTPIPEPASAGLLILAIGGLALRSRRQRA